MSTTTTKITTQPATWGCTTEMSPSLDLGFFLCTGQSMATIGCDTSWFMAQAYCCAHETTGLGVSDAYTTIEFPLTRKYDLVTTLSRSGTTTEIIDVLKALRGRIPTRLTIAVGDGPTTPYTDKEVMLDFADERSVVQARLVTTALALMRASLGEDPTPVIHNYETTTTADIPQAFVTADQSTFLGTVWTCGLANEAALRVRKASQSWAEVYPVMECRHGPISITQPGRIIWIFGPTPTGINTRIEAIGTILARHGWDPVASLVLSQHVMMTRAKYRGLSPDTLRHLTRFVILS